MNQPKPIPPHKPTPADKEAEIKALLHDYAEADAQIDLINMDKNKLRDEIITPEIKLQLQEIEVEFQPQLDNAEARKSELYNRLRALIPDHGETVKGEFYQAVYVKPKTKWDTKQLEGLAHAIPAVNKCKTTTEASCQIRRVG